MLLFLPALGGCATLRAPFSPDTDAITWNLGRTAKPASGHCEGGPCKLLTVNRSLTDRLSERISVLDFGAHGGCRGDTLDRCKVDSTLAFNNALTYAGGEDSTPESWQTVYVPPGFYRVDGTVSVAGQTLVLEKGAQLLRKAAITSNTAPILRVAGGGSSVIGAGALVSENPSPSGVLHLGPANLSHYQNVEYNLIDGIRIEGAGGPECTSKVSGELTCTGLHMDSAEPFGGGSTYQNVIRNVKIRSVDAGVYAGKYVNANHWSGVQMGGLGRYGYYFVNNTENSVFGGFMTGGGNRSGAVRHTVIVGRGSGYNWFVSVQAEPGVGSRYFDFDERCNANAVIGHDNTYHGSVSQDKSFLYQAGSSLHMGNFNSSSPSGGPLYLPGKTVNIQGAAYIRNLTSATIECGGAGGEGGTDLCAAQRAAEDATAELQSEVVGLKAEVSELKEQVARLAALVERQIVL